MIDGDKGIGPNLPLPSTAVSLKEMGRVTCSWHGQRSPGDWIKAPSSRELPFLGWLTSIMVMCLGLGENRFFFGNCSVT